ncbi:MAG: hypothetical protein AAF226_08420, partial [Verrucomicrobiota bacterium]
MKSKSMVSRRKFTQYLAGAAAASGVMSESMGQSDDDRLPWELCTFTKPFQHMSYDQLALEMANLGFDGIECPVRQGGHIEPEVVPDELPKMVEALDRQGLKMTILTSKINAVIDEQYTESLLRTPAQLGIKRFIMGY